MDPLSVLQLYTMRNELDKVVISDDECRFGDEYRFPRGINTAFRSRGGGFYTLESLVLFVKNVNAKHTEYMGLARSAKLQIVTFTDRKPLQEYLEGNLANTEQIELLESGPVTGSSALPPAPSLGKQRDEERGEDFKGPALKKARAVEAGDELADGEGDADQEDVVNAASASGVSELERVLARERPLRGRNAVLLCHKKEAFLWVLAMLNRREDERKRLDLGRKDAQHKERERETDRAAAAEAEKGAPQGAASGKFANPEEKRFWKEYMGTDAAEELGIDPTQSFVQDTQQHKEAGSEVAPSNPRHSTGPQPRPHGQISRLPGGGAARGAQADGPPIILVPSATQTLINMFNVKEFLEEGRFVAAEERAKVLPKKPELVVLSRSMGRASRPVPYHVHDKPSSLSKKDWNRVVAVFVLGKEWQFKDWPFKDHVEIFSKVMGVYMRWDDASVESAAAVRSWNVKILSLSRHKRHQDKSTALQFWDMLDLSLRARKSTLRF